MRIGTRFVTILVAAGLTAACAPAPPFGSPSPERDGTYQFQARQDGRIVIEGTFTLTGGAVDLVASPGACLPDPVYSSGPTPFTTGTGRSSPTGGAAPTAVWRCGDVKVVINANDPTGGSRATYERRVVKSVSVCQVWKPAPGGGRTCERWVDESEETFVPTSVTLRAVRSAPAIGAEEPSAAA